MADINVIVLPDGTEYPVSDFYLPVAISNPTDGQVLKYDETNGVWYNGDDAEGSSVFYGTSAPTSQLGVNGNLYVKYTEGTGGASDTVDALYVKLDGSWCQISTGGGGGTSDYNDLTNKPQINSVELSGNKSLDDLGIQSSEISKTATGSIITFSDGGDDIPVESFECEIVAQQEAGTPTPDNPLLITGFSEADISVCGKNLNAQSSEYIYINLKAGDTIYIKNNYPNALTFVLYFRFTDETLDQISMTNGGSYTYTLSKDLVRMAISPSVYTAFETYGATLFISKEDTAIEPFDGTLYSIDFGQTIYGGRLIYSNGQWAIEATHEYIEFDGSNDESWQMYSVAQGTLFRTQSALKNYLITADNTLCNTYAPTDDKANLTLSGSGVNFDFINNSISDVANWRTNLSNNPITVCFELATPVIIPITSATRVKTISGVNNIYSNTGDNSIKYFTENADEIAELVKAEIASTNTDYHKYSTEEKIVGEWIDGKPIYERTYTFTAPSSNAFAREDLGITMSGISNAWIDVSNTFATNSTMCTNPTFYDGSPKADQFGCYLNFLQTNLAFDYRVGSDFYSSNIVLTIRYTKSS